MTGTDTAREENRQNDDSQVGSRLETIVREGLHLVVMFAVTTPFYLYGGNVLYGHTLFTNAVETQLFIMRAGVTVILVEVFFNWLPYYVLGIEGWRRGIWYVVLSGLAFGLLTYLVILPPHHEGEADIGMAAIWIVTGLLMHGLYRKLKWYS
ncbi:MAG: hypothetical protein ACXADS_14230 [Candidatus Thorarchaeota archaeon]